MNIILTSDLDEFVRGKVRTGASPTETAVVEAALTRLQGQEASSLDKLIDHEFVDFCGLEADESVTLDDVHRATSSISGSMSQTIIEEERAERF